MFLTLEGKKTHKETQMLNQGFNILYTEFKQLFHRFGDLSSDSSLNLRFHSSNFPMSEEAQVRRVNL